VIERIEAGGVDQGGVSGQTLLALGLKLFWRGSGTQLETK
jgi:hypothetical protein